MSGSSENLVGVAILLSKSTKIWKEFTTHLHQMIDNGVLQFYWVNLQKFERNSQQIEGSDVHAVGCNSTE